MVRFGTAGCAFQSPYLTHRTPVWAVIIAYFDERGQIPNGRHDRRGWRQGVQPDRFCTTDVRDSALTACLRRTHVEVLGGASPERPKAEAWKEKSWES